MWSFKALILLLFAVTAQAAESNRLIGTVQVGGLEIKLGNVIAKSKTDYMYLMWDAFPSRRSIADLAVAQGMTVAAVRERVALGIARLLWPKFGGRSKVVKVDVVEFLERDEYGAPRWASVKKLQHLEKRLEALKDGDKL